MEYTLLYLLTLLLIIKNYEVFSHVTGQIDIQDPDVLGALLHHLNPHLYHEPFINLSPSLTQNPSIDISPELNIDPQLVLPGMPSVPSIPSVPSTPSVPSVPSVHKHKPIIIDASDDDDDDWLSLLHFLIIALKNKKHGYNPYKKDTLHHRLEESLRHEGFDGIGKDKTIHINIGNENSKSNSKTHIISHPSSECNHDGHSKCCCCGKNHSIHNGCECVFIPYPIAIPMNFPMNFSNGLHGNDDGDVHSDGTSNDTNDSELEASSTTQQPCSVREPSEISVIIRTE